MTTNPTDTPPASTRGRWTRGKIGLVAGLIGVVLLLCCGGWAGLGTVSGTRDGYNTEHDLTAKYDTARQSLSQCIDDIAIAAGISKQQADSMTAALTANNGGGVSGALTGTPQGFAAFMVRQVPDLAPYQVAFQNAFNTSIGCRNDYGRAQDDLIKRMKVYKDWKSNPTNVAAWFKHWPSDELTAVGPDPVTHQSTTLHGDDAFNQINRLVLNSGAQGAYNNGTYDFGNPYGTPTPSGPAPASPVPSHS